MNRRKYWLVGGVFLAIAVSPIAWQHLGLNTTVDESHDMQPTIQHMQHPTRVIERTPADVVETAHSYSMNLSNEEINEIVTLLEQAKKDGLTMPQRYELLREKGYSR